MNHNNSRRNFLQACLSTGMTFAGIVFLLGCQSDDNKPVKQLPAGNSNDPCSDYSELSATDVKAREALGYVKKSPIAGKHCGSCKLWLPPAPGKECGKCQLFKGPVMEMAYCTYWAPQK